LTGRLVLLGRLLIAHLLQVPTLPYARALGQLDQTLVTQWPTLPTATQEALTATYTRLGLVPPGQRQSPLPVSPSAPQSRTTGPAWRYSLASLEAPPRRAVDAHGGACRGCPGRGGGSRALATDGPYLIGRQDGRERQMPGQRFEGIKRVV